MRRQNSNPSTVHFASINLKVTWMQDSPSDYRSKVLPSTSTKKSTFPPMSVFPTRRAPSGIWVWTDRLCQPPQSLWLPATHPMILMQKIWLRTWLTNSSKLRPIFSAPAAHKSTSRSSHWIDHPTLANRTVPTKVTALTDRQIKSATPNTSMSRCSELTNFQVRANVPIVYSCPSTTKTTTATLESPSFSSNRKPSRWSVSSLILTRMSRISF